MITVRKSADRGQGQFDWLDSKHTFSFGHYHDEAHMAFGPLRVINEDIVAPGMGFDEHGHRDMEIITYVLEGALQHKDSMGNGSIIKPGNIQRMYAGTGVTHSEFNASNTDPVHLLQIWILPDKSAYPPDYTELDISAKRKPGQMTLIASEDGRDDSIKIHQEAELAVLDLAPGQSYSYQLPPRRKGWVQMARGEASVNGEALVQGDGAGSELGDKLDFTSEKGAEILVFTLTRY
jgi:redox-sensitive bicupin YhaK (pirin superfamily)